MMFFEFAPVKLIYETLFDLFFAQFPTNLIVKTIKTLTYVLNSMSFLVPHYRRLLKEVFVSCINPCEIFSATINPSKSVGIS